MPRIERQRRQHRERLHARNTPSTSREHGPQIPKSNHAYALLGQVAAATGGEEAALLGNMSTITLRISRSCSLTVRPSGPSSLNPA